MIGARIKSAPQWRQYKNAVLGVSLNSSNFEPDAVSAILDLAESDFESLTIDLTDTLNRHTYHAECRMPLEDAHKLSRQHGDIWLEKNEGRLAALKIPYQLIRWDHWLKHPHFEDCAHQFAQAFQKQPAFRQAVMEDIGAYAARRFGVKVRELPLHQLQACKRYLLEELTCHSLMYEENQSATLYPGRQQKCYEMARAGLVQNVPAGLRNSYFVRLVLHGMAPSESAQAA